MKKVKIVISGRVQGVFFRAFVQKEAISREVKGYAKNRKDGKLEIVLEGNNPAVDEVIELCKNGPDAAVIEGFDLEEQEYLKEFDEFSIG